jgi:hypothetical protein
MRGDQHNPNSEWLGLAGIGLILALLDYSITMGWLWIVDHTTYTLNDGTIYFDCNPLTIIATAVAGSITLIWVAHCARKVCDYESRP